MNVPTPMSCMGDVTVRKDEKHEADTQGGNKERGPSKVIASTSRTNFYGTNN